MILINYLHVGIDDTDSPDGMCTTFLASQIINQLAFNNINIVGYPRLIRLNPFARHKTRGNGGVSFKISLDDDIDLAKEIILGNVSKLSMFDCDNTNPGIVFYEGEITSLMENYSFKALYDIITIEEAEKFAKQINAIYHKFKNGRGIIGALAAIGLPLEDYTYELLTYRDCKNYGKKRKIVYDSVYKMDLETFPETFENIDYEENYIAIEPKTPCPVLYGIRSNTIDALKKAFNIVKVEEPIADFQIFKTNQHTDMHIQKANSIDSLNKFGCYEFIGEVRSFPKIIEGGHMFFNVGDDTGVIECSAYEPTKGFRKYIEKLRIGDTLRLFGGVNENNTFNIEKFQVLSLNDLDYKNPKCKCGKTMSSAGKGKGFKCKKCGYKIKDSKKTKIKVLRELSLNKFYETPVSARRHLSKPLCRMDLN